MKVINEFMKQYDKEFDFYQKLSQVVAIKLESQLIKYGIKAEVTFRAKRPDKLKDKLVKRNLEAKFETIDEIYKDIVDLAGVRVSLYFPSEREIVDEIIKELFVVELKKVFPTQSDTPKYTKRFSGYWATHYRIRMKDYNIKKYNESVVEIQVASVLMHAWSEVEHDLVYKPYSGDLSTVELQILDEINGLVLSGEIALERLKTAITNRIKHNNEISNQFELTNFILNAIDKNYLNKIKLGDTYLLTNYLNTIKKLDMKEFESYIHKINVDSDESVTDQLLNMFLVEIFDVEKPNLKSYFKNLSLPNNIVSASESYVKCWVVLEKAFSDFQAASLSKSGKYLNPDFKILVDKQIITSEEANQLMQLRQERNDLLHGKETLTYSYLKSSLKVVKELTKKAVQFVPNEKKKARLKNKLDMLT